MTVKIPKAVVDFIKDMEGDVEKYVAYTIVDLMFSYVESVNAEQLMDRYDLKSVFKEYGVLPCYYGDP